MDGISKRRKWKVETKRKINWSKVDLTIYQTTIEDCLRSLLSGENLDSIESIPENLNLVIDLMNQAAEKAGTKRKPKKDKKKVVWDPETKALIIENKKAHHDWKMAGKPKDPNHPAITHRKHKKHQLRSHLRTNAAKKRDEKIELIASTSRENKEQFYALIKKTRAGRAANTTTLEVNGDTLTTPGEICDGWAVHFGNLAKPKDNSSFNNIYKQQVEEDIEAIEKITKEDQKEP